jgi:hypothetical protein
MTRDVCCGLKIADDFEASDLIDLNLSLMIGQGVRAKEDALRPGGLTDYEVKGVCQSASDRGARLLRKTYGSEKRVAAFQAFSIVRYPLVCVCFESNTRLNPSEHARFH